MRRRELYNQSLSWKELLAHTIHAHQRSTIVHKLGRKLSWLPIAGGTAARHLDSLMRPTRLMAAVKKD